MPPGSSDCSKQVSECLDTSDHVYDDPVGDVDTRPTFYYQGDNPYCIEYSLASVFSFLGLKVQESLMITSKGKLKTLQSVIDLLGRTGKFEIRRLKKFSPLSDPNPSVIKVLQICSVHRDHYHEERYRDNSHCITIVDHLVFDPNKDSSISLTLDNLHTCCLGGDEWVFHHVSMTYSFLPGKRVSTIIKKQKPTRKRKRNV